MFKDNPFIRRLRATPEEQAECGGHWCLPDRCICIPHDGTFDEKMLQVAHDALEADPRDPRDELIETLQEQLAMALGIAARSGAMVAAARHLMDVFNQVAGDGTPLFDINEAHVEGDREILRHAILDLNAKLAGSEAPAFCIPERTH